VYDLLTPDLPYLFPVGRLDADSEGLLVLTSDSQLAVKLTDPEYHVPKTYRVTVAGTPSEETIERLQGGVELRDGPTRPAGVKRIKTGKKTSVLEVVLTEGRNRQLRRMCQAVGHKVRRLQRVAIGKLELGMLKAGQWRILTLEEISRLGQS
jgi:23S rRNA pseudouridine2605 synthase